MTETWHELEELDDEERALPRRLRMPNPLVGNVLLGLGGATLFAVIVSAVTEPSMPLMAFSATLCLGALLTVVGAEVKLDDRRTVRQIENQRALERRLTRIEAETNLRNGQLAGALEQNNAMMRQLQAARTVDLNAIREELRATREHDAAVAEGAVKRVQEDIDETNALLRQLIASPAGGGKVVPMPNPAIYQLGIAEGERRAREERDKPR